MSERVSVVLAIEEVFEWKRNKSRIATTPPARLYRVVIEEAMKSL
jgi:hypothetical protein